MKCGLAVLLSLLVGAVAIGQTAPNPDDFERVLIPVFFFGPGASGSQWSTRVAAINGGDATVELARPAFEGSPLCAAICGCGTTGVMKPGDEKFVCQSLADPAGLVLYVPKSGSASVQFQSWISESSHGVSTEVQVVRQKELRTTKSYLLNLPSSARDRVAVRLYDALSRDGVQVKMRAFDPRNLDHLPIFETTVTLRTSIRNIAADPFPSYPSFAMISDLVAAHPELSGYENYFLELTPIKPLDSFWALATITNNDTQQVTTVTPR